MALSYLLAPLSENAFFTNYFEKTVLHIERNTDSYYYHSVLSIEDIEEFMSRQNFWNSNYATSVVGSKKIRPYKDDKNSQEGSKLTSLLMAFHSEKETIILNQVHQHIRGLNKLVNELHVQWPFNFNCNIYITPKMSQGLAVHTDDYDVFVLQIYGSKKWLVYPEETNSPKQEIRELLQKDKEILPQEVTLETGSLLYIPKGVPHSASTDKSPSVHITIGLIKPITGIDVLREIEIKAREDSFFGKSNFYLCDKDIVDYSTTLKEKLHQILDSMSIEEAIKNQLTNRRDRIFANFPEASFSSLLNIENVDMQTILQRRYLSIITIEQQSDIILLKVNKSIQRYPIFMKPAIDLAIGDSSFSAIEMKKKFMASEEAIIKLLKKWVEIGFLEIETS